MQYPHLTRCLFAVPNGGHRNIKEAARMKQSGTLAGVSDLILAVQGVAYFIELKTKKGKMQPTQRIFRDTVIEQGFEYVVIKSIDDFIEYVNSKLT